MNIEKMNMPPKPYRCKVRRPVRSMRGIETNVMATWNLKNLYIEIILKNKIFKCMYMVFGDCVSTQFRYNSAICNTTLQFVGRCADTMMICNSVCWCKTSFHKYVYIYYCFNDSICFRRIMSLVIQYTILFLEYGRVYLIYTERNIYLNL